MPEGVHRLVTLVSGGSSRRDPAEVEQRCADALAAAPALDRLGGSGHAGLLDTLADALEARRDDIVAVADRETGLGTTRLNGELTRTCYQLRLFAEVVREGSYLEAAIDHAGDTPMGPRPDLRRMLVPLGSVAVFGASNFPLAFSVPGGDTASALAAGCPVVLKAHSAHPATSPATATLGQAAPLRPLPRTTTEIDDVWRRDRLGGPIREYQQIAWSAPTFGHPQAQTSKPKRREV